MLPPHAIICLAAFLLAFSNTLSFHATPFYAFDHLGGGAAMSGHFGAVQSIVYTITTLISSQLVTRVKHGLNLALIGVTLFGLTYGPVPFISSPWPCILSSAAGLAGMGLTWPALHSWVGAEPDPVQRARHMSWLNMSWSSGAAVSPLFAGPLYDLDYRYPFIGSMILSAAVVTLIRMMPHESAHFEEASTELLEARAGHDRAALAFMWPAWLTVFVFNMLGAALRLIYPKHIEELVASQSLRFFFEAEPAAILTRNPATIFSVLAFAVSFGTATAFFFMGRTRAWKHRFATMLWPQAAAMAALVVLATSHSLAAMTVAFAVIGAGLGVCFFSCSYYGMAEPALKHRRAAITEGLVGAGSLAGSFGFGQMAVLGTTVPFLWAPVVIVGLIGLQAAALARGRRQHG